MISLLKKELLAIASFFKRNYSETIVLCAATLFIILARHHPVGDRWLNQLFYFFILPVLTIAVFLRRNPLDFGLRIGNCKLWGFHVVSACLILLPILFFASRDSSIVRYYASGNFDFINYFFQIAVVLLSWEFLFRGFLLFGLREKFKEGSILVQMVPFALLHIGKPEAETISCLVSGIYFGYVAYRGGSYWPAFFIHLFINLTNKAFVNLL